MNALILHTFLSKRKNAFTELSSLQKWTIFKTIILKKRISQTDEKL